VDWKDRDTVDSVGKLINWAISRSNIYDSALTERCDLYQEAWLRIVKDGMENVSHTVNKAHSAVHDYARRELGRGKVNRLTVTGALSANYKEGTEQLSTNRVFNEAYDVVITKLFKKRDCLIFGFLYRDGMNLREAGERVGISEVGAFYVKEKMITAIRRRVHGIENQYT